MTPKLLIPALILIPVIALAQSGPPSQRKPCDELKDEIAAKLDAKGVVNYTLTIVAPDEVGEAQVVGSCDGGTKRITYKRN